MPRSSRKTASSSSARAGGSVPAASFSPSTLVRPSLPAPAALRRCTASSSFYDDDLHALLKLIAEGKMCPVIDKVLPLEQAREGLRLIQDREVIGKVVVTP